MRRRWFRVVALLLCLALMPVTAQAAPVDEEDITWKVVAKRKLVPPFMLSVYGVYEKEENYSGIPVKESHEFALTGRYDFSGLAGMWDFNLTVDSSLRADSTFGDIVNVGLNVEAVCIAGGRGEVTGPDINENSSAKRLCKSWQERKLIDGKLVPVDPKTKQPRVSGSKYSAKFDIEGMSFAKAGEAWSSGPQGGGHINFLEGAPSEASGKIGVELKMFQAKDGQDETIVDLFTVEATFTIEGKKYGPFKGLLSCGLEYDKTAKTSAKIPIWGVWNERNPYDDMPKLEKDYEDLQKALAEKTDPKKINYPKGNWLVLKEGKSKSKSDDKTPKADQFSTSEAHTYQILSVGSEDIYFEKGEIWPTVGCFIRKPTQISTYSLDLKERKDYPVFEQRLEVQYEKNSDTLSTNIYDFALYRVRPAQILGTWATVKNENAGVTDVSPALSVSRTTPGTWIVFTQGEGSKYPRGSYIMKRTTVNSDGSARVDSGTAVMTPFTDEDIIMFEGITSQDIAADGKVGEPYQTKDEALFVTAYDKDSGTMKLDGQTYYKLGRASLTGDFSSDRRLTKAPDPAIDPDAALDMKPGTQFISFDSKAKTFSWTQRTESPSGVLVQTGTFSTVGDSLLVLANITGDFYPAPGETAEGFTGVDYRGGEKTFQFIPEKDADDKVVAIEVIGIGKLSLVEEVK